MSELLIRNADGKESSLPLTGERLTLGRSSDNALSYPSDGGLSRFHMALEPEGDRWVVVNLGSKNGTYVNGVRVEDRVLLSNGDSITASHIEMQFVSDEGSSSHVTFEPPSAEPTVSVTLAELLEQVRANKKVVETQSSKALQVLARAARELAVRRPLGEMFRLVLQLTMEAIRADRGVLLTVESGGLTVQASSGGDFHISSMVRDRVLKNGESLLLEQLRGSFEAAAMSESLVMEGVESVLAVPLQSENEILGLIYADASRSGARFSREQLDLMTLMANLAGVSIERERWERQRRELLAENAATLGRLAAALSHEINSPLGALKSTIDTLLRLVAKSGAGAQPGFADMEGQLRRTLDQSLNRMSEVVDRIQRFTNLDRAEAIMVDINSLVGDAIELERTGGGMAQAIEFQPGQLPAILCRPLELNTTIAVLLRHVLQARQTGPVTVVTVVRGTGVEIQVSAGPAERGPDVFDPSFRVMDGRVGAANWSLFAARRMVRELGGDLQLEDRPNVGPAFVILLPVGATQA